MKIIVSTLFLAWLLIGCATSNSTHLPDGSVGHSIDCSGSALTWGKCYEKAGELCGAEGYEVIAGGSEKGTMLTATGGNVFGSTLMKRSMLIRCNN